MPYLTSKKGVLLPRNLDRRVKITEEDKEKIKYLYREEGKPIRFIARVFEGVCSRRAIQYILFPKRLEIVKAQFKERRKDGRYKYTKEKWAETMREHRRYKNKVLNNLIKK
jgi:hypothetical protein